MSTKTFTVEKIITELRETEVALSRGQEVQEICWALGIHDTTYDRWRQMYGGLKLDQAKRLKELEGENARLKRAGKNKKE